MAETIVWIVDYESMGNVNTNTDGTKTKTGRWGIVSNSFSVSKHTWLPPILSIIPNLQFYITGIVYWSSTTRLEDSLNSLPTISTVAPRLVQADIPCDPRSILYPTLFFNKHTEQVP